MEIKENDKRIVIAKPVASRPNYGKPTFSELLAGATHSQPFRVYPDQGHINNIVPAIRPKALRLKPTNDSHAKEFVGSSNNNVVFKPLAKVVSNTFFPFRTNNSQFQSSNSTETIIKDTGKSIPLTSISDRTSTCDSYNWRKYGQKQVKGSEYPRSYYKCTHPNCPVKKMVERSLAGDIVEIVYKGEHNHPKPQPPKGNSKVGDHRDNKNKEIIVNEESDQLVGTLEMGNINQIASDVLMVENPRGDICEELDEVKNKNKDKKRKMEGVTPNSMDNEISNDGYRWRKYGQKVVKGNQYPRSYYRCTGPKCKVRKHVERVSDDPMAFITTYEGKHNHNV